MSALVAIFALTWRDALRRRLVLAAAALGLACVLLYAGVLSLVLAHDACGPNGRPCRSPFEIAEVAYGTNMLALAGMYAANFLTVIAAVLLPIQTLSGEIDSGIVQTIASKPIRRADILVGKWLAYWTMVVAYLLLIDGGIMVAAWVVSHLVTGRAGFVFPRAAAGLALLLLEATIMLTISIAGGTTFNTVTNGLVAVGLFGIGFLGGWMEQIGELMAQTELARTAIRDIGTGISLVIPTDAIWRLAASQMMPTFARDLGMTPFTALSPPTGAIAIWGAVYAVLIFLLGIRLLNRRAL